MGNEVNEVLLPSEYWITLRASSYPYHLDIYCYTACGDECKLHALYSVEILDTAQSGMSNDN